MTEEMLENELVEQYVFVKNKIEHIEQQTDYLIDAIDKLNERLNGMGKMMVENTKALTNTITENVKPAAPPKYSLRENKSSDIGQLTAALSRAKVDFAPVLKESSAHKSKFSSLGTMLDATEESLKIHELSAEFLVNTNEYGEYVITLLLSHSSGQWIETSALLNDDQSTGNLPFHQRIGSAEKYMRRYMYRSMLNLGEEGD